MWEKIMIPMLRLWLHGLYGLHWPRCAIKGCKASSLMHSEAALAVNHTIYKSALSQEEMCEETANRSGVGRCQSDVYSKNYQNHESWRPVFVSGQLSNENEIKEKKIIGGLKTDHLTTLCWNIIHSSNIPSSLDTQSIGYGIYTLDYHIVWLPHSSTQTRRPSH